MRSLLKALTRTYGARRRPARESVLDLMVLAMLAEGRGERAAARHMGRYRSFFTDWNEVRVARPRDLCAASPDAPEDRVKRMQGLLQAVYEHLGSLEPDLLLEKKPSEARAWLTKMGGLSREEVDAVLMIALKAPVLPASEDVARVLRRLGKVPRKSTRTRAQKAAMRGLDPADYREFYSLVNEHAAAVCHAPVPECGRCKLKRVCKSKGRW
jgi:endonuclease III